MILSCLRRRSLRCLRRPLGRLAALLLAVAVISGTLPINTVHVHKDGLVHQTHHHIWDAFAPDAAPDRDSTGFGANQCDDSDPCEDSHDSGLTFAVVPEPPGSTITKLSVVGMVRPTKTESFPQPLLPSLYRPPIA